MILFLQCQNIVTVTHHPMLSIHQISIYVNTWMIFFMVQQNIINIYMCNSNKRTSHYVIYMWYHIIIYDTYVIQYHHIIQHNYHRAILFYRLFSDERSGQLLPQQFKHQTVRKTPKCLNYTCHWHLWCPQITQDLLDHFFKLTGLCEIAMLKNFLWYYAQVNDTRPHWW